MNMSKEQLNDEILACELLTELQSIEIASNFN